MPETALCTDTASTRGLTPVESQEHWRKIVASYQCEMACEFPDGDAGVSSLTRMHSAANQVVSWSSPAVRYHRRPEHMRQDGLDTYVLVMPVSGTVDVQVDEHATVVHPGHAALIATTRPFDVAHTPNAQLRALTIQRQNVRHRMHGTPEFVGAFDVQAGLGGVVQDLLDSVLRSGDELSATQFDAVIDRLVELVCMLIGTSVVDAGDHFREIEAAIRRYVRGNAHDPELNSELIAAELGWSVRQIQLALQRSDTTCRDLIREERLLLARDQLAGPAGHRMSITQLAHRCGFASAGTFSTAFRRRFGTTPRELRSAQR